MNIKTKKRFVGLILTLIFIFVGFLFIQNRTQEQLSLNKILQEQFDNKYTIKTQNVDNFLVTIAKSSCVPFDVPNYCKFNNKKAPLIIIQDILNKNIVSIYEIGFKRTDMELQTGNNITLISSSFKGERYAKIDLLEPETKIKDIGFITEWLLHYGGSSGLKGLVIFNIVGNKIVPVTGYYGKTSEKDNVILTDRFTGKSYSFPIIQDMFFTSFVDLNKNGKTDLLYGRWIWDVPKEGHYVPRPWYLRVYELSNNKFEIAKWWNNGEEYKTQENIGYEKKDELRLLEIFNEKK